MAVRSYEVGPTALLFAAAATLLLAQWLPVGFEYRPNDLGIVSFTTERRYPLQQETFWLLFALVVGPLLAWLLARGLGRAARPPAFIAGLEGLGVLALLAVLWLPAAFAAPVATLAGVGAFAVARRRAAPGPADATPASPSVAASPRPRFLAGAAVLVLVISPAFWLSLWNVTHQISDLALVEGDFRFLGEAGQHLAWANAFRNGGFSGRDVFCLYGPLYDLGIVGMWELAGRSIAAWELYWSLTRVAGWLAMLLLASLVVRRSALVLLLPFLLPWVKLRLGLALFGLVLLLLWLRTARTGWALGAGLVGGAALLYSQEYGLAFCVVAAFALLVRRDGRAALWFAGGVLASATPLLVVYAAGGALGPMIRDLVEYPRYMFAGYGKLPFPSLLKALPLELGALSAPDMLALRLGYTVPLVCVAALFLALPATALDPRRPLRSLRDMAAALAADPARLSLVAIALFGLVAFRSALGRSDLSHIKAVLPPLVILVGVAADRVLDRWSAGPSQRVLAAWRSLALALLVLQAGLIASPSPLRQARRTGETLVALVRHGNHPVGDRHVAAVTLWIEKNSSAGQPVLFLPNDAAYYYLTDRPNPIRFVQGHQIVTQAHRDEVLRDLEGSPPPFVVWDHDAHRVDGLSDELVFGRAILDWIAANYEPATRFGGVEILRRRGSESR